MVIAAELQPRVDALNDMLQTACEDGHPDWLKAYYAMVLRLMQHDGVDEAYLKEIAPYPELIVQCMTDENAGRLEAMKDAIFAKIAQTESQVGSPDGYYRDHEIPAAMLRALDILYPPIRTHARESP